MGTMFDAIASSTTFQESIDESMTMGFSRKKISSINTIEHILELIETSSNILVLTGAGISVSAGIPDFRSENGLYSTLKETFNLTDPSAMFDMKYFINNPSLFYSFNSHIFPGFNKQIKYYPTPTHYFIKSLELKSKLLRNYTQNIDTLEMRAGINNIIACHGSYITASCINCQFQIHGIHIQKHIFDSKIPFCPYCCPHKSDLKHLLNNPNQTLRKHKPIIVSNIKSGNILFVRLPKLLCAIEYLQKCPILFSFDEHILQTAMYDVNEINLDDEKDTRALNLNFKILVLKSNDMNVLQICTDAIMQWLQTDVMENSFGVIKPDVVFFNETLSQHYKTMLQNDIKKCDLLLVMGTSLKVEPVCSIPNLIPENIPAVLINREISGFPTQFDVNFLGNCDDICMTLMHKLNWKLIQPKILDDSKENDNELQQHEIQTIDTYVTNSTLIEYEFIQPNFYLFPNGKLPPPSYVFPENEFKNIPRTLSDVDMIVDDIIREEQQKSGIKDANIKEMISSKCRNSKELLIYGYVRDLMNICSLVVFETLLEYYTTISELNNCFFMYGPLRDDIDMISDNGNDAWCEGCNGYLGIIYGYKLFGNPCDTFPFAKKTNNNNDYIIGRIVCFKDELEFECQLNWADGIKGYDPNASNRNENMFIRQNVECYIFDDLNDETLIEMGYYDGNIIIDFTNDSKVKQCAVMYYHPNNPHVQTKTPHSDWIKRFAKKKLFT